MGRLTARVSSNSVSTYFLLALLTALFLGGFCAETGAEEIVRYEFLAEERDAQLEDILYLSSGVTLSRAGLSSTRTAERAPYTLRVGYASRFSAADVTLALESGGLGGRVLGETSFKLALDYDLDDTIAKAVDELLESSGVLKTDATSGGNRTAIQGLLTAPANRELSPDELLAATAVRYSATLGLGGTVVLGEMTDYFRYGVSGMAGFSARKPWESWSLSVGVRALGTRFINDDGVSGGPLYLSSVGLDVQAGTGYEKAYRISAAVSGGVAVLSVAGSGETLHKAVPYFDVGSAFQLPLGASLFAGLDVRYLVAFDTDRPVMGVVPVVTIRKEFR